MSSRHACPPALARASQPASEVHPRSEARLVAELEPAEYFVVIAGAAAESRGAYELQVNLEPLDVACKQATNLDCSTATPIRTDQTVIRTYLPLDCEFEREHPGSRFFELDLRGETGIVGAHISIQSEEARVDSKIPSKYPQFMVWGLDSQGQCAPSPIAEYGRFGSESERLSTSLEPGRYAVELERPPSRPGYLRIELQRLDCSNPHATCADAEDITLVADQAVLHGHTFCGTEPVELPENCFDESAPQRFYRLDLSDRPERVRVRANTPGFALEFEGGVALLRDAGAECGALLECFEPLGSGDGLPRVDAIVEPGVYLLMVQGASAGAAGELAVQVDISDWRTRTYAPCYGGDVENRMFDHAAAERCWKNPLHPDCNTLFISGGLDPSVADCICETDPVCCAGTEDDYARCAPVFDGCGFLCEDAATTTTQIQRNGFYPLLHAP